MTTQRPALRSYQERLAQAALEANTIVVLPTGAGKTLIAADVIEKRLPGTALFLVPTCLLVDQQATAVRNWLGFEKTVAEYMGGMQVPIRFDVLVSTPKAFHVKQSDGEERFSWSSFDTIIFDEVHHVLKEHPYRKLALSLRKSGATPRVIGLTASLTYAVTEERMKASVQRICEELTITSHLMIVPQEELKAAGYHGGVVKPDMRLMPVPSQLIEGLVLESDRQPHNMLPIFWARIKDKTAIGLAVQLVACIKEMEACIKLADPAFKSPLGNSSSGSWGKYAHQHAKQTGSAQCSELEHWYEALKILATSWEEAYDHVVPILQVLGASTGAATDKVTWPESVVQKLTTFWANVPDLPPRFECLSEVLLDEYDARESSFRGIIFVERKLSSHVWAHLIANDPDLAKLFTPACLYAANSPVTPSLRLTKAESQARIQAFREGRANLLIATAAAEEGMDIPEANCVICFDDITHGVALVQRRGRARQAESSFIIMSERSDRPVSFLAAGEQEQHSFLQDFTPVASDESYYKKQRGAQMSRENTAQPLLLKDVDTTNVIGALHGYCQKTKTSLEETYTSVKAGHVTCSLRYESVLREFKVEASSAKSKKDAKQFAAMMLWDQLKRS